MEHGALIPVRGDNVVYEVRVDGRLIQLLLFAGWGVSPREIYMPLPEQWAGSPAEAHGLSYSSVMQAIAASGAVAVVRESYFAIATDGEPFDERLNGISKKRWLAG